MNSPTLVRKLWNYCNGPGLGQKLARSTGSEYAGACFATGLTLRDDNNGK